MTKEISSEFPPGGQVSLWAYDSVNDKWYAVLCDEDGHLQLDVLASDLPEGAATAAKQLADDHNVTVSNMITGFATALKQLPDGHNVTVDNMITGFATALKQLPDGHNVTVDNVSIEVTQQEPADLTPGVHGWDGSDWRKLPMVWGYSDRYAENLHVANATSTTQNLNLTAVPAGEVWVIQGISAIDVNTDPAFIEMGVILGGTTFKLTHNVTPGADIWVTWTGEVTLKEGDYVTAYFHNCVVNDDLYLRACGYKMKVSE